MFDETTTTQQRKQMDLLCCFWSEEENEVVTKYLTSFFFGRATAKDVKEMLASLQHNEKNNLPWGCLFNISTDGPNINKDLKICRRMARTTTTDTSCHATRSSNFVWLIGFPHEQLTA